MTILYLLLSRTYGIHLYTADLARGALDAGEEVHLVTSARYPAVLYDPRMCVHAVWPGKGGTLDAKPALRGGLHRVLQVIDQVHPDVVHITGPQLFTPWIMARLRVRGIPTVHTLHDLDPHPGEFYGRLLLLWNRAVMRGADVILVHGRRYRDRLIRDGAYEERVAYLPLLHGFLDHAHEQAEAGRVVSEDAVREPTALFFGRLSRYKGVEVLAEAWTMLKGSPPAARLVLAGSPEGGGIGTVADESIELRERLIEDDEALELFRRARVLVLPYTGATQSALIAAAYAQGVPVIVTDSGALPEYVVPGETGWIVPAGDAPALAVALSDALADGERCRVMGIAGRRWYDEQRRGERAGLMALYRGLAAMPAAPSESGSGL